MLRGNQGQPDPKSGVGGDPGLGKKGAHHRALVDLEPWEEEAAQDPGLARMAGGKWRREQEVGGKQRAWCPQSERPR